MVEYKHYSTLMSIASNPLLKFPTTQIGYQTYSLTNHTPHHEKTRQKVPVFTFNYVIYSIFTIEGKKIKCVLRSKSWAI